MSGAGNSYEAVIFDMDGVLADTEPAFFEAVNVLLAEEGRSIEFERYKTLLGTSVGVTWRSLIEILDLPGDPDDYLRRYDGVLIDCLRRPRTPLPGVVDLLEALDRRRVPAGLATSSWQTWMNAVLESAGIAGRFQALAWRQLVEHGKPAPDLYLKAAALLHVAPERCIAVEDTPTGIAAAKAAGMYAVQSRASSTAFPPIDGADLVLDTLETFPLALLSL